MWNVHTIENYPVINSSYQQLHTKKTDKPHKHNVEERNYTPNSTYCMTPFKKYTETG